MTSTRTITTFSRPAIDGLLADPKFVENPYPLYTVMRDEARSSSASTFGPSS